MNKENPSLQRDQVKRPNFHKLVNSNSNGLSSPFPFMEFGLSNQSSLNYVFNNFSREFVNSVKSPSSFISDTNNAKKSNLIDPYLKPLSLDRLKSANILNRDPLNNNSINNFNHDFIKSSNNNLKNNDFSANFFLRIQSTKTDTNNTENLPRKSNEISKNGEIKQINHSQIQSNSESKPFYRENYPANLILPPKVPLGFNEIKKESSLPMNQLEFHNYSIRPNTANPSIKSLKDSIPIALAPPAPKFYVKSFKTESLIYNPTVKPSKIIPTETSLDSNFNSNRKISNPQNLYLQVKQEVEEYRKQRRKETLLDINIVPDIKTVATEDLFPMTTSSLSSEKSIDNNNLKKISSQPNAISNKTAVITKTEKINLQQFISSNGRGGEDKSLIKTEIKDNPNGKIINRPKSVTFNDKIETRDFCDDDSSSSESEEESSNEASSSDNESRGSIVSTESESESENYSKSIRIETRNDNIQEAFVENKISSSEKENNPDINNAGTEIENCKDNYAKESNIKNDNSSESTDDEVESEENSSDDVSIHKCDTSYEADKPNEKTQIKTNNEVSSRSTTSSTLSQSISSAKPSRNTSATSKSLVHSEKHHKKQHSETKSKSSEFLTKHDLLEMNAFKETKHHLPLIFSKFSNVPPVINFVGEGEKIEPLPFQLRKFLRWRTSLLTPVIVKQTIGRSGFKPSRYTGSGDDLDETESNDWILYFGKHMKGPVFKTIRDYQKVNHFPGSFQLGRKDRLWRNIYRMQQEIGSHEFDFIPQTFCLPTDLELFKQCWESGGSKQKWIIKPPASARGIGVKVVYKWNQIPKRRPIVVQKYISNPYLINDSKFDLRLYVFITDINPLKIYLYDDGLVRFASTKYSNSIKSLQNRYVHLTNYSINKQNIEYLDNNDNEACKGHKWSLKSLWSYMKKRGVNTDHVWHRIKDLVVKTIISAEEAICASVNMYCKSTYSVQELFGFDVILDENLKPWILEVNVSPSLHSDSSLDIIIKGGMIKDMFNICGYVLPEPSDVEPAALGRAKSPINLILPSSDLFIDRRFWLYEPSTDEIAKMKHFVSVATNGTEFRFDSSDNLPYQILDCLTPQDVRCLVQCVDEYERRGHFERVYPVCSINASKKYLSYFERVHYLNLLVTSFLTKYNRNNQGARLLENLCQKKLHLISLHNGDKIDSKHVWKMPNSSGDN